jgi:hypothetical protein
MSLGFNRFVIQTTNHSCFYSVTHEQITTLESNFSMDFLHHIHRSMSRFRVGHMSAMLLVVLVCQKDKGEASSMSEAKEGDVA